MRLSGKIALITGGGTGIGLDIAKKYVEEGAYVYITGRRENKLQEAVSTIGKNIDYVVADVTKKEDMEKVAEKIKNEKGKLDILIANAGVGNYIAIEDVTLEEFNRVMYTNVLGTYYCAQVCLPLMKEGSTIILNTSVTASLGLPNFSLYIAAKSAMKSFIHTWTNELRDRKIRVNALAPGIIPTDAAGKELGRDPQKEKELQEYRATLIPANRVGNVKDISNAAIFLGSDESSYVNGIELLVDGGLAAIYPVKL
ncbi:SDR family oxidoreductase [Erysipelatoclostridium sp. An15]|uniref:SDR family NAD(P)-dependent oxidoreductase n=1 Tax=Erysipelatoclostridium sp. An15 TaxID=1965566 RepID=UPI000B367F8E|nr:SDR family oxidoreductase [Erysipelatoclostridium sp. An15]OUQ03801.1 oxidoreductase [Erysipelatoclostridium sp. An15]